MSDELVVLTTTGVDRSRLATKRWRISHCGEPVAESYDKAAWFSVSKVHVHDLWTLDEELTRLQDAPHSFVIRGEPCASTNLARTRRWSNEQEDGSPPTFEEKARRWILLDVDDIETPPCGALDGPGGAAHIRSLLPTAFRSASCWWAFSASAGVKAGLRMRIAFWLDRPTTGEELGRWLMSSPVDHAVFRTVQAIYTAAPIFENMRDPVIERVGLIDDGDDQVIVPDLRPIPPASPIDPQMKRETFKAQFGKDWAIAALAEAANSVSRTPAGGMNRWGGGGRHNALFCAALRCAGLVEARAVPAVDVERILTAAAVNAGLVDKKEIARTIRNGFRQGGMA